MDKKKLFLNKTLVISLIILFVGLTITNSFGISNLNDNTTPPITTISLDPPEPNGANGWYVNDVNVTLNATDDLSGVKEIHYRVDEGEWNIHYGDFLVFILDYDCLINSSIEFYAVDFAGNQEETKSFCCINIDQLPPDIDFEVEVVGRRWWSFIFGYELMLTAIVEDACSGSCGRVEFYFNNEIQETVTGPGLEYIWTLFYFPLPGNVTLRVTGWDNAGNPGVAEVNGSDISSRSRINFINQYSNTVWFQRFFYRFPFLEVFLRIMNF